MTMPPLPYDLAAAVRAARRKKVESLQLGITHPRSQRQHADDNAAVAPVQSGEAVAPGAVTPKVERLRHCTGVIYFFRDSRLSRWFGTMAVSAKPSRI
jgi:hypothetical protein